MATASGGPPARSACADPPGRVLHACLWILAAGYLYADMMTGFVSWSLGAAAPVSQFWKGLLLVFVFLAIAVASVATLRWLVILTTLLLLGPVTRLIANGDSVAAAESVVMALKVLLPIALLLFYTLPGHGPVAVTWMRRILWSSVVALAANLLAGILGYGYTSYGTREMAGVGIVGFFPAGNEVSAALLILSGFVLSRAWLAGYAHYLLATCLTVTAGFLIATKAAIIGTLVLLFLVPLAYRRLRFGQFRPASLALLAAGIALFLIGLWQLWAILETIGLADRVRWIYEQRGLMGILFSGRDEGVAAVVTQLPAEAGLWKVVVGVGPEGMRALGLKSTLEIDPLDLALWFGIPGVMAGLVLFWTVFLVSLRGWAAPESRMGPGVLATNLVLLSVSTVAGHVLLGGMAGIALVTLNALVLVELRQIRARARHPIMGKD